MVRNGKDSSDWVSQSSEVWLIAREVWETAVSVNKHLSSVYVLVSSVWIRKILRMWEVQQPTRSLTEDTQLLQNEIHWFNVVIAFLAII